MPTLNIEEKGCRGCTLCVDICPVQVFDYAEKENLAKVARQDDCIGCLSCYYLCPSQCLTVTDIEVMRPFHRIEENVALVEKFLQEKSATKTLTKEDSQEANHDVAVPLNALAAAVTETMGRGQKAGGRKAGTRAAGHLPEMYEEKGLEDVLKRMQERFRHGFDFDYKISGQEVELTFKPCGLHALVTKAGDKLGDATLCQLFHEYWAGLIGAFCDAKYRYEVPTTGTQCTMKLMPG